FRASDCYGDLTNRQRFLGTKQQRFNDAGEAHTGCHPERSESEVEGSREIIFKLSLQVFGTQIFLRSLSVIVRSLTTFGMTAWLNIMLQSRFESRPQFDPLVCRASQVHALR